MKEEILWSLTVNDKAGLSEAVEDDRERSVNKREERKGKNI